MTIHSLAQPLHAGVTQIAAIWARIKTAVLVTLVITLLLGTVVAFALWDRNVLRNSVIVGLMSNHDVAVNKDAAPKLLFARAYFLITHGKLDEAQSVVSLFDLKGSNKDRANLHYDLANGRLKAAFDRIEAADFDKAGAFVGVAQADYIEAMRLNPDLWDARFNFDVATRLVRQYPSFMHSPDPRREGPRPIWTELPNVPRGEP